MENPAKDQAAKPQKTDYRKKGREAEDQVAEFLLRQGVTIITRRYSSRFGEIDLIGMDGDQLVFFEVKERTLEGSAEQAIGSIKWNRLSKTAQSYLRESGESLIPYHFELVTVTGNGIQRHRFEAGEVNRSEIELEDDEMDMFHDD